MTDEVPSFDEKAVSAALEAARSQYQEADIASLSAKGILADDGHLSTAAGCISVKVVSGKVCIVLPLGIGKVCLPVPKIIPNGTLAEVCLHICTTWGIPTGVKVTVSVAGKTILQKTFGKC